MLKVIENASAIYRNAITVEGVDSTTVYRVALAIVERKTDKINRHLDALTLEQAEAVFSTLYTANVAKLESLQASHNRARKEENLELIQWQIDVTKRTIYKIEKARIDYRACKIGEVIASVHEGYENLERYAHRGLANALIAYADILRDNCFISAFNGAPEAQADYYTYSDTISRAGYAIQACIRDMQIHGKANIIRAEDVCNSPEHLLLETAPAVLAEAVQGLDKAQDIIDATREATDLIRACWQMLDDYVTAFRGLSLTAGSEWHLTLAPFRYGVETVEQTLRDMQVHQTAIDVARTRLTLIDVDAIAPTDFLRMREALQFGLELESIMEGDNCAPDGWDSKDDCSIDSDAYYDDEEGYCDLDYDCPHCCRDENECGNYHRNAIYNGVEWVLDRPMSYSDAKEAVEALAEDTSGYILANESCGLHVHFSPISRGRWDSCIEFDTETIADIIAGAFNALDDTEEIALAGISCNRDNGYQGAGDVNVLNRLVSAIRTEGVKKAQNDLSFERYTNVNFCSLYGHGSIEWRAPDAQHAIDTDRQSASADALTMCMDYVTFAVWDAYRAKFGLD